MLEDLIHFFMNTLYVAQVERELLEQRRQVFDHWVVVFVLQARFGRLQLLLLAHQLLLEPLDAIFQQTYLLPQVVAQRFAAGPAATLQILQFL